MKKRMKMISLLLSVVLLTSTFIGCGDSSKTIGEVKEQEKQNIRTEIPATEYDLVSGGSSKYFILIPEVASENEVYAAEELQLFIKEATGAKLPICKENEADVSGSFLSVGNTKASLEAGVEPTYEEVNSNGFVLETVEDDCYLKGFSDIGTRNSVYEWLAYALDWEIYAADEIVYTETKDLKLLAFEQTVVPSIEWRSHNGPSFYNEELAYRSRQNLFGDIYLHNWLVHNSMTIVDPTVYDFQSEEYKDWYSETMVGERPAQLCYSNEQMRAVYIENLLKQLKDAKANAVILGMEDNVEWCTCEECTASKDKYGTNAAVMIHFANKVQEAVNVWNAENRVGQTPIKCVFFAYYQTVEPPVTYDKEKKIYKPIDDSVVLHEDLGIMFAPITASYSHSFTSEKNADTNRQLLGWSALTNNIHAWTYAFSSAQNLIFFNTFEIMQENYRFLIENGTTSLYDQTNGAQGVPDTGWASAQFYVQNKLMWNVDLNMEELLDDFFDNYFDVASETMRKIFNEERSWVSHIYNDLGATGNIYESLLSAEYWTYPYLKGALAQFDKAYEEIEIYRESDPERYKQLNDRITLEKIQYQYLMISLYGTNYTEADLLDMKYTFKRAVERLGLRFYVENVPIEMLWAEWMIDE